MTKVNRDPKGHQQRRSMVLVGCEKRSARDIIGWEKELGRLHDLIPTQHGSETLGRPHFPFYRQVVFSTPMWHVSRRVSE